MRQTIDFTVYNSGTFVSPKPLQQAPLNSHLLWRRIFRGTTIQQNLDTPEIPPLESISAESEGVALTNQSQGRCDQKVKLSAVIGLEWRISVAIHCKVTTKGKRERRRDGEKTIR